MNKKNLRTILNKDYAPDMVKSIMSGRRKPNGTKRNEYEKNHAIPFEAWDDLNSYLMNNTIKDSNTTRLH